MSFILGYPNCMPSVIMLSVMIVSMLPNVVLLIAISLSAAAPET